MGVVLQLLQHLRRQQRKRRRRRRGNEMEPEEGVGGDRVPMLTMEQLLMMTMMTPLMLMLIVTMTIREESPARPNIEIFR